MCNDYGEEATSIVPTSDVGLIHRVGGGSTRPVSTKGLQMNATIERAYDFEAAHRLPKVPDGHKCKTMHGHSYTILLEVTGVVQASGPEEGMVVDFGVLDAAAAELKEKVDHSTLNETLHTNPTVENMAPLVWDHFQTALFAYFTPKDLPWRLSIRLKEGPRSGARYPPEEL